ncbi:MAG: protein kinase [Acidobacteriota bacterium]
MNSYLLALGLQKQVEFSDAREMQYLDFIGQTLDGKYHIERELGRGGMGTVYLATHLGTERPVAVKIISPQFMQRTEFVERFRREARAAGRLRHPNVVNVTDFGFADSKDGQVAYLVMEYLDGCTLGEILDEEKNLPVQWTLDILDQVCSAVQEAHEQGIIHRDLKPDNIWLEPNQRGGYTVKVLDFGIAKLEENEVAHVGGALLPTLSHATLVGPARATFAGSGHDGTLIENDTTTLSTEASTIAQTVGGQGTRFAEGGTQLLEPIASDNKTAILDHSDDESADPDTVSTRIGSASFDSAPSVERQRTTGKSLLDSPSASGLTRVGAVLGTPLYMSPEQCRGEHLDPRSDIYSLGVIAYQMLSGSTPFSGDFKDVMDSHKNVPTPQLVAKGVRKKMRGAVYTALAKDPDERPQTAEAFSSVMRARSEGIAGLLRRALVIYSEHLPKFLLLSLVFELPVFVLTVLQTFLSFLRVGNVFSDLTGKILVGISVFFLTLASAFCATLIIGSIVWLVTQYLSVPLRPIRLKPMFREVRSKWKRVSGSGAIAAIAPFVAASVVFAVLFAVIGGGTKLISMALGVPLYAPIVGAVAAITGAVCVFFTTYVRCMLMTPAAMMEPIRVRDAFKRSRQLTGRAFSTSIAAALIMFIAPVVLATGLSVLVNISDMALDPKPAKTEQAVKQTDTEQSVGGALNAEETKVKDDDEDFNFSISSKPRVAVDLKPMDMRTRVKHTLIESFTQIIWLPIQILVISFSAIIVALLYLKTRLAGGESMNDLFDRFEDEEGPRRKWQERVRQRLIQSGRIPSKS